MWIWESKNWPEFTYDHEAVIPILEKCIQAVSPLKQLSQMLTVEQRLDWEAAVLLDETLSSAKIEGELFDRDSVRSSIVNKLGISKATKYNQESDSMVELLLRSIRFVDTKLNHEIIKTWHHLLFPIQPLITPMLIGEYRLDKMQILSGRYGKQQIHYLAPGESQKEVTSEMSLFFKWLNTSYDGSGYIRAAIAKFWFVTIHPFDDGNGRLSRIIAERCLAEAESTDLRLFSLSSVFEANRSDYYQQLENQQRGNVDLTNWIIWFLSKVEEAALNAKSEFERVIKTTFFWQQHQSSHFNIRQLKLVTRMLETKDFSEGISRRKYKALTKTSDATAVRDLADLVNKKVLMPSGGGRSHRYSIIR
jgi:Fic family protein